MENTSYFRSRRFKYSILSVLRVYRLPQVSGLSLNNFKNTEIYFLKKKNENLSGSKYNVNLYSHRITQIKRTKKKNKTELVIQSLEELKVSSNVYVAYVWVDVDSVT